MSENEFDVVTGAFGYSGKYITRRLLELGHAVHTLTNSVNRPNPFGEQVQVFSFSFEDHGKLTTRPISVNSLHHQGVNRPAAGRQVSVLAPDGLIEAFAMANYPFGLAVQWHPEELQELTSMRNLFKVFVRSCQPDDSRWKAEEGQ